MAGAVNGILSASPSTWAVRLLLGGMLLQIVVMILIIHSTPGLDNVVVALIMFVAGVTIGAIVMAVFGEPAPAQGPHDEAAAPNGKERP
jgi:hypothetical protein